MATPANRLWRGALLAWLGMLAFATLLILVFGPGDSDFSPGWRGRFEAMWIPVFFFSLPLALACFGALPPLGLIVNRLSPSTTGLWIRAVIGIGLAFPAFFAFVVATKVPQRLGLLGPKRSTLAEDFAAIAHRPAQAIPFLILLAVGGVIFALTSRPARSRA
jgi:hypothetical protein